MHGSTKLKFIHVPLSRPYRPYRSKQSPSPNGPVTWVPFDASADATSHDPNKDTPAGRQTALLRRLAQWAHLKGTPSV